LPYLEQQQVFFLFSAQSFSASEHAAYQKHRGREAEGKDEFAADVDSNRAHAIGAGDEDDRHSKPQRRDEKSPAPYPFGFAYFFVPIDAPPVSMPHDATSPVVFCVFQ
jgi:hypothetical protein